MKILISHLTGFNPATYFEEVLSTHCLVKEMPFSTLVANSFLAFSKLSLLKYISRYISVMLQFYLYEQKIHLLKCQLLLHTSHNHLGDQVEEIPQLHHGQVVLLMQRMGVQSPMTNFVSP